MNLKKINIISIIVIFLLNFLFHYIYELFPNFIFSILFPINESVFEHMKMLFSSVVFGNIIKYILLKKYNINYNNFLLSTFITSLSIIPIYLTMFLPIYFNFEHNLFVTIFLMLISIIIIEIISYYILKKENKNLEIISFILIIITYLINGYLTYNPLHNTLFYY